MSSPLEGVEPQLMWKRFQELCTIPRCSKNEAEAAKYVVSVAESLGLEYHQDVTGNVLVVVPATEGREKDPTTIVQGHLDMVCEKDDDVEHDFERDPIRLRRDGKWLMAQGTSLGADNGVGVSTGLALMETGDISHGPLECLFTVDEETGLTGASKLSENFVSGRRLLNLDSEEDGSVYIGCAGGIDMHVRIPLTYEPAPKGFGVFVVKVGGLRGGHSGIDISGGRGNGIKILAGVLDQCVKELDCRLAKLEGGSKRNAIARDGTAYIWAPEDREGDLGAIVAKHRKAADKEFSPVEEGITITVEPYEGTPPEGCWKETGAVVRALMDLPHGVIAWSKDIEDLVETSVNLATLATKGDVCHIGMSGRSSVESELRKVLDMVKEHCAAAGGKYKEGDGYPGWQPNLDSPILGIVKEEYTRLFGEPPEVKAIHAGLECGIIGKKFPGMDMVAMGPQLEHPHSPEERVDLESVERFWKLVVAVLEHRD